MFDRRQSKRQNICLVIVFISLVGTLRCSHSNGNAAEINNALHKGVDVLAIEDGSPQERGLNDDNYSGGRKSDFYGEDPNDPEDEGTSSTPHTPKDKTLISSPKRKDLLRQGPPRSPGDGEYADETDETADESGESSDDYQKANTNECDQSNAPKSCFTESLPSGQSQTSSEERKDLIRRTCSNTNPCPK